MRDNKTSSTLCALVGAAMLVIATHGAAQQKPHDFPDGVESDPATMGWMQGSPPPADRTVRFADGSFFQFPARRWSVSNFRQLMPTANVSAGSGQSQALETNGSISFSDFKYQSAANAIPLSLQDFLDKTYTDGLLILHRGEIIFEKYLGVLKPDIQHGAMSITKTFVGTLAAALIHEGVIDEEKTAAFYVPEIAGSAFANATIRQIIDMTTGIQFSEKYADPKSDIWLHAAAGNPLPKPADYQGPRSYFEYLQSVKPEGEHGEGFRYRTINTDMLGWILAKVTGKKLNALLSDRFWQPMGMEYDAYIGVDSIGTPFAGGGLSLTLRDLARFGEMMRNKGQFNGRQIIPESVVTDTINGGDRKKFEKGGFGDALKGWSYRNMWWVTHNEHSTYMARGVFGQTLYIDPKAELVIARFASHPIAANAANDAISLPTYQAIAEFVMQRSD